MASGLHLSLAFIHLLQNDRRNLCKGGMVKSGVGPPFLQCIGFFTHQPLLAASSGVNNDTRYPANGVESRGGGLELRTGKKTEINTIFREKNETAVLFHFKGISP